MYLDAIEAAANAAPQDNRPAPIVPGLVLHVDGDYLAYYCGGNEDTTVADARLNALAFIESYRAIVGADKVVVHTTAKGCQKGERFLIATVKPYQGQRTGDYKPKHKDYLLQFFMEYDGSAFKPKVWTTREADDGIAACAHFAVGKQPGYIAIATRDKDLRMLPGVHIDWVTRQLTTVAPGAYEVIGENGKLYGTKWFWIQMLMGDTADNCPGLEYVRTDNKDGTMKGLKKIGEAGAFKALADAKDCQEAGRIVLNEYIRGYPSSKEFALDRFCEQAALLWMRCDFDGRIADFAHHAGHSRINHIFDEDVWAAVKRLEQRVESARAEINSFGG